MKSSISDVVEDSYELMPRQMKVLARWLLDPPTEVASLSMREQARRPSLPPTRLTRFSQRLGFDGFDRLKDKFADTIGERPESFAGRAEELLARCEAEGDAALIGDAIDALDGDLNDLASPSAMAALAAAADVMVEARNILCFGLRSRFPTAYLVHYVASILGSPAVLIEGVRGTPNDVHRSVDPGDALLAVQLARTGAIPCRLPSSRFRGAKRVALTDSELSSIGKLAAVVIRVPTGTPSLFHTNDPSLAAAECLVELITAQRGSRALEAFEANEAHFAAFDNHVVQRPRRREL